jgi:precorrin-6A/cobalt-precorrin-6A reductase
MPIRVLLLGDTAEARALAACLVADGVDVTSSLAGRVADPQLPVGTVRIGDSVASRGCAPRSPITTW